MKQKQTIFQFNRGLISEFALAREDVKRVALGATIFNNFIARVLGSMAFRQGWKWLGNTLSNNTAKFIPFVFSTTDTALLEFTDSNMRIWINDALLTRPAVTAVVTNPTFTGGTGWTNADDAGCTSSFGGGSLIQVSNGTADAIVYQLITCHEPNVEHALRIVQYWEDQRIRVGSTLHGEEYISDTVLNTGIHSLSFTPTGNFYIEFRSGSTYQSVLTSCTIESSGVVSITTSINGMDNIPTVILASDLNSIRYEQSADVIYLALSKHQYKIERHSTRSWSIVAYQPQDGPFRTINATNTTIATSGISGNITLTASKSLFKTSHIGALFAISSVGQIVTLAGAALNDFTNSIRITGVGTTRNFIINLSGFMEAGRTIQLQYSTDNTIWYDVAGKLWTTTAITTSYTDGFDNQIIYYRLKITVYTNPGTTTMSLSVTTGSIRGIVQVIGYINEVGVSANVLVSLGNTTASLDWEEGSWSDYRGWPSSVRLHDGRLWWFGKGNIQGSLPDAYESFDNTVLGDGGVINRSIGYGPVDTINWGISAQVLWIGTQGSEIAARSSSLGEPLTPSNFNIKTGSTQGSAGIDPIKVDQAGIFVHRNGIRVYQLLPNLSPYQVDPPPTDLTALVPELGLPGIVRMAVQRQPDTRIHCVRSDGTVMLGTFDTNENVLCWSTISSGSEGTAIEDVVVLPGLNGSTEDQVYYLVKRFINGSTVRFLEKWALETECRGGTLNKQADAHTIYSGVPTTLITGLSYLEGQKVIVWGDGKDLSPMVNGVQTTYTVTGGVINLPNTVSNAVIGLPYTGQWQSVKLGEPSNGTILTDKKNMSNLGLVLAYVHPKGIQYGSDFGQLFDMPSVERGIVINADTIRQSYDEQRFFLDGGWDTDMRLVLQAQAPRPVTVMACVCDSEITS